MKEYAKPLLIDANTMLYADPDARMFYHLRTDCPCFKYGGAESLQALTLEQMSQRDLQPCFFCGYEPPPPPTRKERIASILTAPLVLFSLSAGIIAAVFSFVAFMVVLRFWHSGLLPTWACVLVGAGIAGLGIFLDVRYGWIE